MSPAPKPTRGPRFWKRIVWSLRIALAIGVLVAVWFTAFDRGSGTAPVLPDTGSQFSLDLEVIGSMDHDVVYVVEQRARPAYRIFAFDPSTGVDQTIFTVPEDAIIYGIALSPDGNTLAIAYSPDFHFGGSGLWTLDLTSLALTAVAPVETDVYFVELEWSSDGQSVLATRVDRTAADEQLAIADISLADGSVDVIVQNGIAPAVDDNDLYDLTVDDEGARRSIGVVHESGETSSITVGDAPADLDHLLAGTDTGSLQVAVLDIEAGSGLTVGEPADAHGNHEVESTWWDVVIGDGSTSATPTTLEPIITYDASSSGDAIVYATQEGLSIARDERTDLIASRAIRFVAG